MPAPIQELDELDAPPPSKLLETRDSISSIDSDVSLSFDARDKEERAHLADLSDSASDAGGKDSGCEVAAEPAEPPFDPPSAEQAQKIVEQVEFYFSDANIAKDAFLLKHVKRNKEGYVSLKLISSFKRVKHLTKDWRAVAHALAGSTRLQINEAGTKLRRVDPLPLYDETTPSRTIVAVQMPLDRPTIESVAELFKVCGEIALIRVLRPGNPIPADVRPLINKNPTLAGALCALVEFVTSESARRAVQLETTLGGGMRVYELNNVPHADRKKKTTGKKSVRSSDTDYVSSSESEDARRRLRRGSSAHFPSRYAEPAAWLQRRLSASSTEANFIYMPRRLSYSSRESSDSSLFVPRRMSASNGDPFGRRMSSASDASSPRSRSNSSAFQTGENVVRLPRGPDGSKGFQRQRTALMPIAQN